MNQKKDIVTLKLPDVSKSNLRTVYAQLRPTRKGGVRLQHQFIDSKHICHNYGHGGAGISLSYGSAYMCAKQLTSLFRSDKTTSCAVLGAGIMGLMTAIEIAKKGYKVTVYSEQYSLFGQKDNKKCITSQIAPGLWLPYWYDNTDMIKHMLLSKLTYEFFDDAIKQKKYKSVRKNFVYDRLNDVQQHEENDVPEEVSKTFEKVLVRFREGGQTEQYLKFQTIQINVELLLQELQSQALTMGIRLENKRFNDLKDVLHLNEVYIANCTAMGSKYIFNDQNMVGVRGHLLEFPNPFPNQLNYVLRYKKKTVLKNGAEGYIDIYCHPHRILVGWTKQIGKQQRIVQEDISIPLHQAIIDFVNQRSLRPKL